MAQSAWKEVTSTTIKNYFEKCGFYKEAENLFGDDEYLEIETHVKEIGLKCLPQIKLILTLNLHDVDLRMKAREECIDHTINPTNDPLPISSDENSSDVSEDASAVSIGVTQSLALIDQLSRSTVLENDDVLVLELVKKCYKTRYAQTLKAIRRNMCTTGNA